MNRTVLYFSFLFVSCAVLGQGGDRKIGFDFDLGGAIPTNGSISNVFHLGMDVSMGPKLALTKKRNLWLKAVGGFRLYAKSSDVVGSSGDSNSVTEHFTTWKAGLEIQYFVYQGHRFSIEPLARIDYNWSSNYYSETIGYDPTSNTTTIGKSDNALSGNGVSYDLGLRVRKGLLYLKLDYEYYRPKLTVNKDLVADAATEGFIIPSSQTFDLSSFNFGLGVTF
jgi:hypothetical protein